jgi:pyrophosphatase PpaX
MPPLQTALFDLDGTLIDSIRLILDSYHHTLTQHQLPARSDEEWLRGVGTPLQVQFSQWRETPEILEAMIATYREYNLKHHDRMVTIYPGVLEAIREMRAEWGLFRDRRPDLYGPLMTLDGNIRQQEHVPVA